MLGVIIAAIFSAIVMILVVMVLRYIVGKQISKIAFLLIWGIITFRLLVPVNLISDFSIWNIVDNPLLNDSQTTEYLQRFNWLRIFLIAWGTGVVVFATYFAKNHLRFRKKVRDATAVTNAYILEWQKYNKTFRTIDIKQSSEINSPLTFGILRPRIILPDIVDLYEEEELKYILAHEYVHIRRFDYIMKIALAATLSIHWFNPFVWIMYIVANRDIELSCDEIVISALDKKSSTTYAMTLIDAADAQNQLAMMHTGFDKHALEERVRAILEAKKKSNISAAFAVTLTVVILFVFAAPIADAINHRVQLSAEGLREGIIVIDGQEINLEEYRSEHGAVIYPMPGANVE